MCGGFPIFEIGFSNPGTCNELAKLFEGETPSASAWTYFKDGAKCQLFETCESRTACENCASGTTDCPSKFINLSFLCC